MMKIMQALVKWKQYLSGRKFMIRTNHNSIQYLLQQKTLSTEQQKWIEKIVAFYMEIIHKKGKENVVADTLSKKDEDITSYSIVDAIREWLDEIRSEYAKDPETSTIINNSNRDPKFEGKNNILWYKGRIYLNSNSKFNVKVMKESHDSPATGHVVFFKYYYNARRSFLWKGMQKDIQQYVVECDKCQRNKRKNIST